MTINCIVVDDEPIARYGIMEHISQVEFLNPVAECKSAVEAVKVLNTQPVDLMFLDIEMPGLSGIELVKSMTQMPLVVFTTAYPQYAIEGFELEIFDYLLKPVSFARFLKTAHKAHDCLSLKEPVRQPVHEDFFFVKSGQRIERVVFDDILYIEGMSNYLTIHTQQKKHVAYLTLKHMEERLPPEKFVRIHRSYIVAVSAVTSIDSMDVSIGERTLPVSKNYRAQVMARIEQRMFRR